mgnify:FL=1
MDVAGACCINFDVDPLLIRCYSCGSIAHFDDKEELRKWKAKIAERKDLIGHSEVCRFFCENCGKRK